MGRIQVLLFEAVEGGLLAKLPSLAHSGQIRDFRAGLRRLLVAVAGVAAIGTVVGVVMGPFVVEIMFPTANLGSRTMGMLAAGAGLYMLAMACAQALIALGGHRDQALGWASGCVALGISVALFGHDLFFRVELALLVGSAASLAMMSLLLVRRLAARRPVTA